MIRGTVNSYDIYTDLDAKPVFHDGFWFHQAFYASAEYVYEKLKENKLVDKETDYLVTGHSLGGSIAVLLSYMIIRDYQARVKCYAYGMSCVGDI